MIEKLKPSKMSELILETVPPNQECLRQRIYGAQIASDYYDAQIDAQAKTMRHICKIWLNSEGDNTAYKYAIERGFDIVGAETFAEVVKFYLATGGKIKE